MRRSSIERLEAARAAVPEPEIRSRALERSTKPFPNSGFALIAEVKPRSPSVGDLGLADAVHQAVSYEMGGATAISVLTEPSEFGGSLQLLEEVAAAVTLPVMRKDFLVDGYQVWEARAHGADGVLVVARMLSSADLHRIVDVAAEAGLFALVEVFDADELDSIAGAIETDARVLVGVNSRDLATLEVRRDAHHLLAPLLPSGVTLIAESGVETGDEVRALSRAGYNGVLVGTALMRSGDPGASIAELINAAVPA